MPETIDPPIPPVRVRHRPRIAPIWVLPLVALAVGLWLVWRSLLNTGPRIELRFDNAEGIAVNQTQVRYKGIPLGVVRQLTVLEDLTGVVAEVQFEKQVEAIPEDSQFWLVQPQISAAGVTGLNTLLSGNYIAIQLGDAEKPEGTSFTALKAAPPLPTSTPGLHIQLQAERLGSIAPGTPIYYRQIPIGAVQSTAMSEDGRGVRMDVHILPEHAKRVRKTSRFWNASGLKVSANLSGLSVETESLASLVSGGIALSTNDEGAPPSTNGDRYTLYPDYDAAEAGLRIRIRFASGASLTAGSTKVIYKGMPAGKVLKLDYDENTDMVVATVGMDPRTEPFMTDAARFWLVKPQLSVAGVSGLDALLTGTYISFSPDNSGQSVREFVAADGPSPLDYREPGLHLLLTSRELGSLNQGSPIYYRQVQVGEVVSYTLDRERDKVDVHLLIKPEYRDLVNESTRFWNVSGVTLNAGLSGVRLRTESLATLLAGGIAFDTPKVDGKAPPVGNGFRFSLFRDEASARARRQIRVRFVSAEGLTAGQTQVIYRGLPIGLVDRVDVSKDFRTVEAYVGINPGAEHMLTTACQFWLVRPEINASRVSGLDALFSGSYIAVQPGAGKPATEFLAHNGPPPLPQSEPGLHLLLEAPDAGSLTVGAPVLHKKLTVGSIQDVRLAADGKTVQAHIHIQPAHAGAVNAHTRFWSAGGVDVRGGVSGLKIRTESLAAIIAGGVAFDGFEAGKPGPKARNGERYKLYADHAQAELAGFPVKLRLTSAEGLAVGTPLRYQGVDIGELARIGLEEKSGAVLAEALVKPTARPLLRDGSQIWRVKPSLGLARTEHLDTLVSGSYLALRAGIGAERYSFTVADEEPVVHSRPEGRNLVLETPGLGSLKVGDPLLYRQLKVGEIIGTELAEGGVLVRVYVHLPAKHAALVRQSSRFWQASGLEVSAGLFSGVQLRSESLEALVAGGIAFANPEAEQKASPEAAEGAIFALHKKPQATWLEWQDRPGKMAKP
ncbi:MAG: MCE family protein [Gammaproteobacteria bacterium]|nr:MCE family protein [Gammaproteobacteria bacterium]